MLQAKMVQRHNAVALSVLPDEGYQAVGGYWTAAVSLGNVPTPAACFSSSGSRLTVRARDRATAPVVEGGCASDGIG